MFIVTNNLYKYFGDKRAIEKIYPTFEKYLEYLKTRETDGILTYGIGDWVFYKAKTPTDYTSTAFYYLDNKLMAKFSSLIGKDGSKYEKKAEELRKTINQKWYNPQTGIYATGTQAGQAVALALGLADQGEEQKIADKLVEMIRNNNHQLDFGMLGSKFVPSMLTKYGYVEDAYQMITKKEAPSWANWIGMGLTSLPETWVLDKDFKDASLNHVFLGDVTAWMTNTIAGINYDEQQPGFSHIIIRPHFIKDLTWAKAEYNSVKGLIKSEWKKENGKIYLTVTIPANTTSTLYIDKKVELKSGTHKFVIPNS
jgi:alpha-L-rhamnosidase